MIDNNDRENPLKFNYPKKQRAFSDFVDGITLTVVAVLIVVIFMVSMTNIAFDTKINVKDFGVQVFILYFCTVSVNLLLRSFGRRKGRIRGDFVGRFSVEVPKVRQERVKRKVSRSDGISN